ncbi:MAG: cellulose synthase/poly-beta-1,6-N-acetylglucosamine synthase-like glycosyltransferase [Candidatus Paceibacteria bacterium]|jgi:cellulose synthase/poly-beta-1,6-N-acetylglucosamine synthase-like glycosyltransferase
MEYVLYIFLFITLYFQIFLLVSFFEKKEDHKQELSEIKYLSTTIIVPCYNEDSTVQRTIESLLCLNYPKSKLTIMIIDDGSTDQTWEVIQKYKDDPRISLHQKENEGSKFAALNFALHHVTSELVGVLDADSWVDSEALDKYMKFFADPEVMATIPSMVIGDPDSILRRAQKAEYDLGLFARKSFAKLNAIYITPGPFSVFRKYVFDSLGPYREAHHTEDAEIALRMQKNGYKIAYSDKSIVYTVGPKKVRPLIKQRVRWVYGFLRNMFDYKEMIFKKKYQTLGMIVLPIGIFRIFISVVLFPLSIWLLILPLWRWFEKISLVGYSPSFSWSVDWFFVNVSQIQIFTILGFLFSIMTIWIGRELVGDKRKFTIDIFYMFFMYTFIAPIWLIKSSYNALRSKKESWR